MAVPMVFIANGIMLWIAQFVLVALFAGFAIMFPDVTLSLLMDLLQWAANIVSNVVGAGELPDIQAAFDALPIEVKEVMVRIRLPEAISILVVAYGLSMFGWIWRFLFVAKTAL